MKIKAVRGTKDILPEEIGLWRWIEGRVQQLAEGYGYRQIRTPLLEEAALFSRSIGASSDIVRKEMYSFLDRKKRLVCLRPEGTASVVRAYLEHGLDKEAGLSKFYYLGPMFRAERPQAGRLRQFHHIGVEAIGSASPYLDAEVISLAIDMLKDIGIKQFILQLNSLGCQKDRHNFKQIIKKALQGKLKSLCGDCQRRNKLNILRIFDCKNDGCKKITQGLPAIVDSLCPDCAEHFTRVKENLKLLNIPFTVNPHLVRGLDYYTKTCFEIVHPRLGAQNALGAGGRYDDLVGELGEGAATPAIGFALGIERLIAALESVQPEIPSPASLLIFIAVIGDGPKQTAFKIAHTLRQQGIASEIDYLDKSLKGQMRLADKLAAKFVAIIGEDELNKGVIILRDMQNKTQKELKIEDLADELRVKG